MENLIAEFKEEVIRYLKEVNNENFGAKYDGLSKIVLQYGIKGVSPQKVIDVFIEINRMAKLNEGQDEILLDISSRVEGKCTPGMEINW